MTTSHRESETARVLKFTGPWEGRFEPTKDECEAHVNALNDARHMRAAKQQANDWRARLLLGLLCVLTDDQRTSLELIFAAHDDGSEAQRQAASLVRYQNSSPEYRERVKAAVEVLGGEGAQ